MILVADESVDQPIVERLRHDGHDVTTISESAPSISDDDVLREANARGAVLLTEDKDFGELVYRLGRAHAGVVLIRLAGLPATVKAQTVANVIRDRAMELTGAFTVITPGAVRIRKNVGP
jgi:predicted nuclease of predicted toxin-antitoxin system